MKTKLLPILLLMGAQAFAQQGVFALTGKPGNNIVLNDIREIDLSRAVTTSTLLNSTDDIKVVDAKSRQQISQTKGAFDHAQAHAIAALAYDMKNNKTVYIPLFSTNIFVIDNKTKVVELVSTNNIKTMACDLGSQFTRMTAGADGAIYAVSNSGSQWLRITSNKGQYKVEDLGELKDDVSNGSNSIKTINIGYGGDMIADSDNNLYIISASANIFKVNNLDNTAKYLGKVSGLPEGFTLNGAAVSQNGDLILATAKGGSLYTCRWSDLEAKPMQNSVTEPVYDLASPYLLKQNRVISSETLAVEAEVYPTRVTEKVIHVKVASPGASVELYDASGQLVMKSSLKNKSQRNTYDVAVDQLKTGMYLVNILDSEHKPILSKKIMVSK